MIYDILNRTKRIRNSHRPRRRLKLIFYIKFQYLSSYLLSLEVYTNSKYLIWKKVHTILKMRLLVDSPLSLFQIQHVWVLLFEPKVCRRHDSMTPLGSEKKFPRAGEKSLYFCDSYPISTYTYIYIHTTYFSTTHTHRHHTISQSYE